MFETIWDDIKVKNDNILQNINEYNAQINAGAYLEYECELNIINYYNILSAHIFNLLLGDKMLYISQSVVSLLCLNKSDIFGLFKLKDSNGCLYIDESEIKETLVKKVADICFNDKAKNFIQELCAQDIVSSKNVAKEIIIDFMKNNNLNEI